MADVDARCVQWQVPETQILRDMSVVSPRLLDWVM